MIHLSKRSFIAWRLKPNEKMAEMAKLKQCFPYRESNPGRLGENQES